MTDGQNNFVTMTDAVLAVIQQHLSILAGNTKVLAAVTAVDETNKVIKLTAGNQAQINSGPTLTKHQLWVIAATKADKVCTAVKAYADDINDVNLAESVHFTYKSLLKGAANVAVTNMQTIHNKAKGIDINLLEPFKIDASDITELQTSIIAFSTATPMKRVMVSNTAVATGQFPALFTKQRTQLKKLDNLVNTYRTSQPLFVDTYFRSRKIIHLGKSTQAEELHLLPKHFESIFGKKFNEGDTFTIRNHDNIEVSIFLTDSPNTAPVETGIVVKGNTDIKLEVAKDFKGMKGHWLMFFNPSTIDDAHVTIILAHGKSTSSALNPGNIVN